MRQNKDGDPNEQTKGCSQSQPQLQGVLFGGESLTETLAEEVTHASPTPLDPFDLSCRHCGVAVGFRSGCSRCGAPVCEQCLVTPPGHEATRESLCWDCEDFRVKLDPLPGLVTDGRTVRGAVYQLLAEAAAKGMWLTIPQIARELRRRGINALETTISARIRDIRKPPPAGMAAHVTMRRAPASRGVFEYFLGVES